MPVVHEGSVPEMWKKKQLTQVHLENSLDIGMVLTSY